MLNETITLKNKTRSFISLEEEKALNFTLDRMQIDVDVFQKIGANESTIGENQENLKSQRLLKDKLSWEQGNIT